MTVYPKPTQQDIEIANAIIARVVVGKKNHTSFAKGDFEAAAHLSRKYTGWNPSSCCNSQRIMLHDKLRAMVGMAFARKPLEPTQIEARIAICHSCPVYHKTTGSCGRLIIDAISPHPISVNGQDVLPCGCVIALKALFKSETCPGKFWP